jgi:hypothetical protein
VRGGPEFESPPGRREPSGLCPRRGRSPGTGPTLRASGEPWPPGGSSLVLADRATCVPFTGVFNGPQRTATDNHEAARPAPFLISECGATMSSSQPALSGRQLPRGHLLALNRSFRRTLEAENKSPRTIEAYTDAVRRFWRFFPVSGSRPA